MQVRPLKIKRVLNIIIFILPAIFYFIAKREFPLMSGKMLTLMIFLLLDAYLWLSISRKIKKYSTFKRYSLSVLYWIPFTLVISLLFISLVIPFHEWSNGFRTYFLGAIFITYISKLVPIVFYMIADFSGIFKKAIKFFYKRHTDKEISSGSKLSRGKFLKYAGLIGGGFVFSGLFWGMFKWVYDFKIKKVIINLPKLTVGLSGLRIIHISDIHLGSWASITPLKQAVEMINKLDPDLVVFTGDLVNYSTDESDPFEVALSNIKSRYGVYSILGNHDYGEYVNWDSEEKKRANFQKMINFHEKIGWRLLRNEHEILNINGSKLALIGVENWSESTRYPRLGDMKKATAGIDKDLVKLLLTHDPTHWKLEVSKDYQDIDITCAGHTHGMQFGIEIPGRIR